MNFTIAREQVKKLRETYPSGSEVKLIYMEDKYAPPVGTTGRVVFVDDIGQIHVAWENGSSLALIEGVDKWIKTSH